MSKLQDLEKKVTNLYAKLDPLLKEIDVEKTKVMIACFHCKKRNQIGKLTYIQTHWYTSPHGCTGGDYWNSGDGEYVCPKCGHNNRLWDSDWYGKKRQAMTKKIIDLKYSFKKIENTYDKE